MCEAMGPTIEVLLQMRRIWEILLVSLVLACSAVVEAQAALLIPADDKW